jgi:23S rRNA (pseudouridine1915-N3)-methyltransferase
MPTARSYLLRRVCSAAAAHAAAAPSASLARAARPVPLKLISVAKGSASKGAAAFADEWAAKLRRYAPLTEIQIKPNPLNAKEPAVAQVHEGERVLKAVNPGDRLIVLDERGRDLSSEDFARLLAQAGDEGWPAVVFAIGGPYGHPPEVRKRADDVVRLSSCVLNHAVARVVLLEQLYRGWTILRGEPYHH